MSAIHPNPSPLAGKSVVVDIGHGEQDYHVEDYWDRVSGGSWMFAEGNPAALNYAIRSAVRPSGLLPTDDEVLYGKIGQFGHLVHVNEVVMVDGERVSA